MSKGHDDKSSERDEGADKDPTRRLDAKTYFKELGRLQIELVKLQEWIKHAGLKSRSHLRGPRRRRQGRHHQAHHRAPQSARRAHRRPGHAHRAREDGVVLPALRRAPAGRRRDGPLRPLLVQPRRRRARHGLLQRGRGVGVLPLLPGVRAHAHPQRHHPLKYWFSVSDEEQEKRFQRASQGPAQALEAQPDGPREPARAGWSTRRPRTRCSATPTPRTRPGRWSTPTTSGARGSTASTTC